MPQLVVFENGIEELEDDFYPWLGNSICSKLRRN